MSTTPTPSPAEVAAKAIQRYHDNEHPSGDDVILWGTHIIRAAYRPMLEQLRDTLLEMRYDDDSKPKYRIALAALNAELEDRK